MGGTFILGFAAPNRPAITCCPLFTWPARTQDVGQGCTRRGCLHRFQNAAMSASVFCRLPGAAPRHSSFRRQSPAHAAWIRSRRRSIWTRTVSRRRSSLRRLLMSRNARTEQMRARRAGVDVGPDPTRRLPQFTLILSAPSAERRTGGRRSPRPAGRPGTTIDPWDDSAFRLCF
jgi:hypothetical protein